MLRADIPASSNAFAGILGADTPKAKEKKCLVSKKLWGVVRCSYRYSKADKPAGVDAVAGILGANIPAG